MFSHLKKSWQAERLMQKLFSHAKIDKRLDSIESPVLRRFFRLLISRCHVFLRDLLSGHAAELRELVFYKYTNDISVRNYYAGYRVVAGLFLGIFFQKNNVSDLGENFKPIIFSELINLLEFSNEERQNIIEGIVPNAEWFSDGSTSMFFAYKELAKVMLTEEQFKEVDNTNYTKNLIQATYFFRTLQNHYSQFMKELPDNFFDDL